MKKHLLHALLACGAAVSAMAEPDTRRAGKLEVYGAAEYLSNSDATISVEGVTADVHYGSLIGGGFGLGYNLNDHWNFNFTLAGGTVDALTRLDGVQLDSQALMLNLDLNLDYNLLEGPLTPFLTAGLSITDVGDDLETTRTSLTYFQPEVGVNGGAGIRWDFADHWFLKVLYRAQWKMGIADLEGDMIVHGGTVAVGYKF